MLLIKRKEHFHISVQEELELLRDENVKLRDSLVLQSSALEREKKQKELYIGKFQKLEKEKAEALKRCQELLLILIKNNICLEGDPFTKICDFETPAKGIEAKDSKTLGSKATTARASSNLDEIALRSKFSQKIAQNHTQALKRQQSENLPKRTSTELKKSSTKLLTLKEVNGSICESRGNLQSVGKKQGCLHIRKKLSYIQKVQSGQV